MNNYSNEARNYVRMAKSRLLSNRYETFSKDKDEIFYLNNRRVTRKELEELNNKVEEIVCSDDCVMDPLNRLIMNNEEFAKMDEANQMRYMLELSHIYITIKGKIKSKLQK